METAFLKSIDSVAPEMPEPRQLASQTIHTGRIISLKVDKVQVGEQPPSDYDVVTHPGGVCVLPVLTDGRILFVNQFRYAVGEQLLELPAGKLDVPDESSLKACKRELWEEAGSVSAHWEDMGFIYTAPGFCNERIYLFRAGKVAISSEDFCNPDEGTQVVILDWNKVLELLANNQFRDAKTLALLALEMGRRT